MRNKLGEEEILTAAWTLLEKEGLEKFSMRKLSQLLDIKAPSLYWYVKSKEEIFDKLASQVLREINTQEISEEKWQEQLWAYGITIEEKLREHPYSAYLLLRVIDNLEYLELYNRLFKIIDSLPFEEKQKFATITTFLNYIISFEIDFLAQKENAAVIGEEADGSLKDAAATFQPSDPVYKIVNSDTLDSLGSLDSFHWGLTLLIRGMDALAG